METESVRSGQSEHSSRSRRSRSHSGGTTNHHHRSRGSRQSHRSNRSDRSYSVTSGSKREGGDDRCHDEEMIEVQILPQDDNWGDNTTAITGNTSEHSVSVDDLSKFGKELQEDVSFKCHRLLGTIIGAILAFCAFFSPIVMVVFPKIEALKWNVQKCGPECDGLLISFSFKLLILFIGTWAVFLRKSKATMPRIFIFRALVLTLVLVFTFSYWLFYGVRIVEKRKSDYEISYHGIVLFSVSLVDALLFIHYLAVVLMEIRQLQPQYFVKVVRSPDGESHCYCMGQLSIQRAAVWVLERYYRDFSIYNPYLDNVPTKTRKFLSGFKVYDVDAIPNNNTSIHGQSRAFLAANARRRDYSHNERFYEEQEYDRRVKKRRARLITAAEEAFTHIQRIREEHGSAIPMDPSEAAQAIFPSMARALQKYLRITRQQPRHTMQAILDHLALCLSHDLSPRAFLEKYLTPVPVLQNNKENKSVQTWALVCDTLLSRPAEQGCVFMLRQNEVSLLVSTHRLPHFNITEEIIDPKSNKFILRLNSETSV
ncbi:vang-like protein 2 [Tachypleus tridentatus]|uniref:vang-like protein 2 n=1 Tax=Tachypleus tridentatus TaxID=6853 RepID=UPI003FD2D976